MANLCENKVVVIGAADAVRAFVEAAAGKANAYSGNDHPTERSIIAAVRAGTPVSKAFRDANIRIDNLKDTSAGRPFDDFMPMSVAIKPIPEEEFEAWAAEYEGERDREPSEGTFSHLSLQALRPIPPEIDRESYHLLVHSWCLTNWGCKYEPIVDAPVLSDLPDGRVMATYPTFDTPNNTAVPAFKFASSNHPDLTIITAWSEEATNDFGYAVSRRGELVVCQQLGAEDLDPECFEEDDGYRWVDTGVLWEKLLYAAMSELEEEHSFQP